jgi:uncharacterized protein involved in response to NO
LNLSIPLLAYSFRPFFLLTGLYGALVIAGWIAVLLGGLPLPVGWSPVHWHSHEMLFGMVSAAISGFLLTAMCNWTGATPLRNGGLLALVLLWLAGRIAMWTAGWLPAGMAAVIDLLFLPVLGIYALRVLIRHNNRRNLVLGAILLLLTLANLLMHAGFLQRNLQWLQWGENMAFNLITLMMAVIAGRITPAFSANWLRAKGGPAERILISPPLDRAVLIATALLVPADFVSGLPVVTGTLALAVAALHAVRLGLWRGWLVAGEPLLWILHVAYLWIVLALILKGLGAFELVPPSVWQHALGVGGIGTLIIGVMTRVGLGHTGRPLRLPPLVIGLYGAILLAAVIRILTALQWFDYRLGLMLAATGWIIAFAGFSVLYWPILSRPRPDGRPG